MARVKVPLYGVGQQRAAFLESDATKGAVIGTNLLNADGSLFDPNAFLAEAAQQSAPQQDLTTDDVTEGQSNLYFLDARAQDAVGGILDNAAVGDIAFTYDNATPLISGRVARMTFDATSGAAINSNSVVCLNNGQAFNPDLTNATDISSVVGLAYTSTSAAGQAMKVMTGGTLTESAWNWSPGRIYCDLINGALTQAAPLTGAVVEVARVISPTTIEVGIKPAILRST